MIWISSRWPSAALFSFLRLSMWNYRLGLPRPGCASQAWAAGNRKLPTPPAEHSWWCEEITGYLWGLIFFKSLLWWFLSSLGNDDLAVWGWLLISPFVLGRAVQCLWHNKSCWGGLGGCLSWSCLSADTCLVAWSEKTHLFVTGKIRKIVCELGGILWVYCVCHLPVVQKSWSWMVIFTPEGSSVCEKGRLKFTVMCQNSLKGPQNNDNNNFKRKCLII